MNVVMESPLGGNGEVIFISTFKDKRNLIKRQIEWAKHALCTFLYKQIFVGNPLTESGYYK